MSDLGGSEGVSIRSQEILGRLSQKQLLILGEETARRTIIALLQEKDVDDDFKKRVEGKPVLDRADEVEKLREQKDFLTGRLGTDLMDAMEKIVGKL